MDWKSDGYRVRRKNNQIIADGKEFNATPQELQLMAAAPEMLEALKRASWLIQQYAHAKFPSLDHEILKQINAAIEKAQKT